MKRIKVLGSGCSKCSILMQRLIALKTEHQHDIDLVKITDLNEIISYGVMMTPGLVIDGVLKSVGAIPGDAELLQWIKE